MSENFAAWSVTGTWVSDFGPVSVTEKNSFSCRLSVQSPAVDEFLAVSCYLADGFRRCAISGSLNGSETGCESFVKGVCVQMWFWKDSHPVTLKDMISILRVLKETLLIRKHFTFSHRVITAIVCCSLLVQNCTPPDAGDIAIDELFKNSQQHRALGNIEDCQLLRIATVFSRFVSIQSC